MTKKLYLAQQELFELDTMVRHVGRDERGSWIELYDTICHPKGGGQKSDRGTVNGLTVVDVAHGEHGRVLHYVEAPDGSLPQEYDDAHVVVDRVERSRNAAYHTAGHLLAAIGEARNAQLRATGGHHWPGEARIEFAAPADPVDLSALEADLTAALAEAVAANLPVAIEGDPFSSRAVRIGAFAPVGCGGTHVSSTRALGTVVVKKARLKAGALRVSYELA